MAVSITAREWLSRRLGRVHSLRLRNGFARAGHFAIASCLLPELKRDWKRVDVEVTPPFGFVTRAMKLAVVHPANRNDELVAHPASEGTRLGKGEVMRIRWHAAAHKACLPQYEFSVVLIAQANYLAQGADGSGADCSGTDCSFA
jgi:hypothetical protein